METICGHGLTFKIKQEDDGWWSIYRVDDDTLELIPLIQAADREHALSYIEMRESPRVKVKSFDELLEEMQDPFEDFEDETEIKV